MVVSVRVVDDKIYHVDLRNTRAKQGLGIKYGAAVSVAFSHFVS